ncbi:MAG TPA: hypothetical protein VMM82_01395, partial [Spirochaetia bacterium]|nr:hypothetical protein [Spirochaetia bacterium]
IYAEGSVGSVFLGDDEVVRQVYFALRDRNWNTVPGVISDEDVRITSEGFLVTFSSTHQAGSIRFSWKGTLQGEGNGRLTFTLDGTALNSFLRNRVGFCVLHPMEVAGKPCTVTHPDGTTETASFPDLISPHQPFRQIRKLSYPVSPRTAVTIQLEGEVFEMEDQRNWTDASFKTYSTPLDLPFPVEQPAGSVVHQTILITPSEGAGLPARRRREQAVSITLARQERFRLPQMGFLWRAPFPNAPDILLDRLRRLRPDYLRFDMHPGLHDPGEMAEPLAAAVRLGAPLELAAFLGADEETEMTAIVRAVKQTGAALRRVLVFKEGKKSTPSPSLWTARKTLDSAGLSVALCAGTDAFFAELNRERPDMSAADGVTFSINPQVHVFDNESMVQSLAAQAVTIRTALSFSSGKPVHVSPVTFRMRWNPNATEPEQSAGPPDPRQLSLFGAAWTAGSIHSLASAGADSVTYFETFGGRGLMEG